MNGLINDDEDDLYIYIYNVYLFLTIEFWILLYLFSFLYNINCTWQLEHSRSSDTLRLNYYIWHQPDGERSGREKKDGPYHKTESSLGVPSTRCWPGETVTCQPIQLLLPQLTIICLLGKHETSGHFGGLRFCSVLQKVTSRLFSL